MKKIILSLLLLLSLSTFSQEVFTFKSGGRILQNGKLISPTDVRAQFNYNQNIINLYDAGRVRKTFGNVLLYGGISLVIGKFILDTNTYIPTPKIAGYGYFGNPIIENQSTESSRYPYYIGGAMILSAIPIKIGFSKKIRKAILLMNEEIKNQKTTSIESSSFIANSITF